MKMVVLVVDASLQESERERKAETLQAAVRGELCQFARVFSIWPSKPTRQSARLLIDIITKNFRDRQSSIEVQTRSTLYTQTTSALVSLGPPTY